MRLSAFALAGVVGLAGGVFVSSCGPVRPACTPSSCSTGCCDGLTGRCVLDTSSTQCGQRGETCKACMLSEVCTLGVCSSSSLGGVGGGSAGGFTGVGSAGGFTGGGSAGG
ncbi:MAG: hypothetical protein INH37_15215, partial [Myxococcaceae bacterium]|nr:hypothetical protein [Myxococcaceae bacterium]